MKGGPAQIIDDAIVIFRVSRLGLFGVRGAHIINNIKVREPLMGSQNLWYFNLKYLYFVSWQSLSIDPGTGAIVTRSPVILIVPLLIDFTLRRVSPLAIT